jgi:aspartyl protease family protein
MSEAEIGRLMYLGLLGSVLVVYLILANRNALSTLARGAVLWGLIFLGVVAGYGLWDGVRDDIVPKQTLSIGDGTIEVPRGPGGHYYLTLDLNGTEVEFIVDTGATDVVLTKADAARIGIDPKSLRFTGIARTANGTVRTARVLVDEVRLGGFVDRGVTAFVNEGALDMSLLGMGYLQRYERIEIHRNRLILTR